MSSSWFNFGKKTVGSDLVVRQIEPKPIALSSTEPAIKNPPQLSLVANSEAVGVEGMNSRMPVSSPDNQPTTLQPASSTRFGLRFAPVSVESTDELSDVKFAGCLNANLGISPQLFATVAVVKLNDSTREVGLLLSASVTPDIVEEVVRLLTDGDWSLTRTGSQAWLCNASLIMSVSQGHLDDKVFSAIRKSRSEEKSALWQSFINIAQYAFDHGANDIDYIFNSNSPMSQVAFKIEGRYLRPEKWRLPSDTVSQMLGAAWQKSVGGNEATFQPKIEQQCIIYLELANRTKIRLRWSGMALDNGCVVTLRIHRVGHSAVIRSLEDCGYLPWHLEAFKRAINTRGGLTTLAGTVGSGKTVTLAILMGMFPADRKKVSFEDPVEIDQIDTHQKSILRDLISTGADADAAFAPAVRSIFRSALDVFLLGEIRDVETGRVARAVLESGHSTLTTTHTNSATGIFNKFMSPQVGIPLDVLGTPGNIRLNVYQALVSKTCQFCGRAPAEYALEQKLHGQKLSEFQRYVEQIETLFGFSGSQLRFRNPYGCAKCRKPYLPQLNGLMGRTVAVEMLEPDDEMLELLLAGKRVEIQRYWRSLSDGKIENNDFAGKTAMEVAMHKASLGVLDPYEIESQFESFAGIAHKRKMATRSGNHYV